jgi:acyl carrier protein
MFGLNETNGQHRREWGVFVAVLEKSLTDLLDEQVSGLTRTMDLIADLGLDSFAVVVLLDELEARMAVSLPAFDDELTVGRLFDAVERGVPGPVDSTPGT